MKFKHVLFGFLGASFVLSIILQQPIIAWAQNTTLWYGSQGGKAWTLASGGTITANSGSAVTLAGTNTLSGTNAISGASTITGTVSMSKLLTLTGGVTSSGPLFQHSGVARFTGGLATSTGADTLGGSALRITAPGTITALQTFSGGITSSGPMFQHSGVTYLSGGTEIANACTLSGAWYLSGAGKCDKLMTLSGGVTSSGPLFQHSGVARFTGGLATSTGADTLGGSALRITAPSTQTSLMTLEGGVTSSGPIFTHSGVTNLTGGFKTTGADTLASSVLNVTSPFTYTYSGILTVEEDSTTAHVGISGLDATNWVCLATVNTDTAVTVQAIPAANLLQVKLSGAVLAGSAGVKVSYVLFKKSS